MLIRVINANEEIGLARDCDIDLLINRRKLSAFCRSDGWVIIGEGRIRQRQSPFPGAGKRWSDIASNLAVLKEETD
jgi:hypothetical protein